MNVNTSKWAVNQIIALDNLIFRCDLTQCSVQEMQVSIVPKCGCPPLHPSGSTLIYFPHFLGTVGPISGWAATQGDIKGDGNYRFQAFWPRISGSQTVGVAGLTGGVTGPRRDSEKKKNVGRLSKVPQRIAACLSGSEQPARRIFLMIRKDIFQIFFFQDGERGDKCRGAGGADQGAGAGEHEFEVPAGQVPDHLCLAGGDSRQTGYCNL